MTRSNSLGLGLQQETVTKKMQVTELQRKLKAAPVVQSDVPQLTSSETPARKPLRFHSKMPGISKPSASAPKGKRRLVVRLNVKSPALKSRLVKT